VQVDVGVERCVFAGVADSNDEFAGIDDPFVGRLIPIAEGARVERERDVPGFAGSETDFGEALQLALGAIDLRGRVGDVELATSAPATLPVLVTSKLTETVEPEAAVAGASSFENLKVV
jgi:hypothetical protein